MWDSVWLQGITTENSEQLIHKRFVACTGLLRLLKMLAWYVEQRKNVCVNLRLSGLGCINLKNVKTGAIRSLILLHFRGTDWRRKVEIYCRVIPHISNHTSWNIFKGNLPGFYIADLEFVISKGIPQAENVEGSKSLKLDDRYIWIMSGRLPAAFGRGHWWRKDISVLCPTTCIG